MTDAQATPDFEIGDAPEVSFGKEKEANPYAKHIEALIANGPKDGEAKGKAITFTPYKVEGRKMTAQQLFDYVVRKVRADIPAKYTVRTLLKDDGRVQLWLIPRIVRKPKVTTEAAEAPAEATEATDVKTEA